MIEDKPKVDFAEDLSEEEKYKEIFAYFGRAIFFAQLLEQHAINMIVIYNVATYNITDPKEEIELWNKYDFSNKTFGVLIKELNKCYNLKEQDKADLQQILKWRNYITHDYFRFNSEIAHSDSGKKRILNDLNDFYIKAKAIETRLSEYFQIYKEKVNITEEQIREHLQKEKEIYKKMNIDENYKTILK
jgi:hypothetical protein